MHAAASVWLYALMLAIDSHGQGAAAQSPGPAAMREVTPGQSFSIGNDRVDVHAPASSGWQLLNAEPAGVAFVSGDESTGRTFAATATLGTSGQVELLALAKRLVGQRGPEPRYKLLEANFELSNDRPYACVKFRGTRQDSQAHVANATVVLPMYVRELICQPDAGVILDIEFSQRGGLPDAALESQATSFLDGVQLHAAASTGGPRRTKNVEPVYPKAAEATCAQGDVVVEATIGPDGKVGNARVVRSVPLLDNAALDAVKQWEFTPTIQNGVPVPVVITTTVSFAIQNCRPKR